MTNCECSFLAMIIGLAIVFIVIFLLIRRVEIRMEKYKNEIHDRIVSAITNLESRVRSVIN